MIKIIIIFLFCFCFIETVHPALSTRETIIIHPKSESNLDKRYFYHWAVLAAAMEATKNEGPYTILEADSIMSENRTFKEIVSDSGKVTIIRDNCSKTMEQYLLPVKVPLMKGALGWRVFIIPEELQKKMQVHTLEDLKKYSIGAGQGWGNIQLLRDAGFTVTVGSSYEGLFGMVMLSRFDLFDRGIIEAPIEVLERNGQYPDMVIEKNILLRYPILDYFYVNKKDVKLAARIERGLNIIISNGTLDRLFEKYYWKSIKDLQLQSRIIFDIPNPDIGTLPSPDRKELWLNYFLRKKGLHLKALSIH
jgi:ABC-type amino acid transport substrate-binding protein